MKKNNLILSNWNKKIDDKLFTVYISEYATSNNINLESKNQFILKHHWNNKIKAENDCNYLKKLKKKLLPELAKELNKVNKTNISVKGWNLILGTWLNTFLLVSYDRFYSIEKVNKKFKNLITFYTPQDRRKYISKNTLTSMTDFQDERWNYVFMNQMIEYFNEIKIICTKNLELKKSNNFKLKKIFCKFNFKRKIKNYLFKFLNFFLKIIKKGDKNFVVFNTGFSLLNNLFFAFRLKGNVYLEPEFSFKENLSYEASYREWNLMTNYKDTNFEKVVKKLIPQWLPIIFLEGFKFVEIDSNLNKLSTEIKVIFTVYGHYYDDVFKIWAAQSIDKGSKLAVASHCQGVPTKFNIVLDMESEISDLYLVTGEQTKRYPNSRQIGQFWTDLPYGKYQPKGKVLLVSTIQTRIPKVLASYAIGDEMINFFYEQTKFYNLLSEEIKKNFRVRLYQKDSGWNQYEYWSKNCSNIKFANNKVKLYKQIAKSRLIVCPYYGRTFIEILSANVPAIIFWDPKCWIVADFCLKDFENLKSAGIFHDNPETASYHLNSIWDNIDSWWFSENVQNIRREFCLKYGYRSSRVYSEMTDFINNL